MKGIKKVFKNIDAKSFKKYLMVSFLIMGLLITFSALDFTQARYETNTEIDLSPTLAFFVVDVQSQTGQIKLEEMVPREEPYLYVFNVSNFKTENNTQRRANVDLTYSIEIITTTNMPLDFRIFKGAGMTTNEIDSDTTTTDVNGVYYRHLVINDVSTMNYSANATDVYTLWVKFPSSYKNHPDEYAGVIDLVDIKINAEQVV